jgi:hypothetical protein
MKTTGYTLSSGRFCHSTMPAITLSVMVEMVCLDTVAPYTSARCAEISPCVSPFADSDRTISSTPPSRRCRFLTSWGSKVPARSRGTRISTGPTSVVTVLARCPLRWFSRGPSSARSCFPAPRWSVNSPSSAPSRTRRVSSWSSPPSPVSCSPRSRAWATSASSAPSSRPSSPCGTSEPPSASIT